MDEIKIMRHLSQIEHNYSNYEAFVREKRTNLDNMAKILNDSRFLTAPFSEHTTVFQQARDNFVKKEHLPYEKLQWVDIEDTSLGRRLESYFDNLKREKKALLRQI
jgi:hypothetical protein